SAVLATRHHGLAVRTERRTRDRRAVRKRAEGVFRCPVPQLGHAIVPARKNPFAVRADCHAIHSAAMEERPLGLAGLQFPERDLPGSLLVSLFDRPTGEEEGAVWGQGQKLQRPLILKRRPQRLTRERMPAPDGAIFVACYDQ